MTEYTPQTIRELIIPQLRQQAESLGMQNLLQAADALEYLLQFVDWKPASDKPSSPSLMIYPPNGDAVLEPRYGVGRYARIGLCDWDWSMPPKFYVPLPPPPQAEEQKDGAA